MSACGCLHTGGIDLPTKFLGMTVMNTGRLSLCVLVIDDDATTMSFWRIELSIW